MIRVIVADDEQKVCQLICHLIDWKALDMELVGTASNGLEALRMVEELHPDLMLTDIRMPGFSGLELMKRARELDAELEFIVISGYSRFEYAQAAIQYGVQDYILKPVNQQLLNATLQKVRQRYQERHADQEQRQNLTRLLKIIWYDLENGEIPPDIGAANEKYCCHFQSGIFQCFCLQADFQDREHISLAGAQSIFDLLLPKAEAAMETQLRPLCQEFAMSSRGRQIMGILNYAPQQQRAVREQLMRIIGELSVELRAFEYVQPHLSISDQASSLSQLQSCLAQARRAIEQRLLIRKAAQLLTDMPEDAALGEDGLYRDFSLAARRAVDLQSAEHLSDAVEVLRRSTLAGRPSGVQLLRIVKTAYHLFLLSGMFQNEYHFYPAKEREDAFNDLSDLCGSAEDLFAFLDQSCRQDLTDACQLISRERTRPINAAKQFISEHYAEPLSLDDVCSHVGFSVSYFSTLFRKETGKTFLEYLLDVRIEAAKGLLRESRLTVEAVCEAVGVHDAKRFSKAFKKATGISPKEYRNLYS